VRTDDGLFVFQLPGGERLRTDFAIAGRFRGSALAERNRSRNIRIPPATVVTRWQGETMDYSLAIDALLAARNRASSAGERC
jgi:hypothetical protein